jgi:hypothetical protein
MKPIARLLVIQRPMTDAIPINPSMRGLVEGDLMQLVYSGGRERTEDEYQALLQAAGLELALVMQADGLTWLMEARPAKLPRQSRSTKANQ